MKNKKIKLKIKLKNDILIDGIQYLKKEEIIPITEDEYYELSTDMSIDRKTYQIKKGLKIEKHYTITEVDVDHYIRETITTKTEILN